ncbi:MULTISPECIES: tRNA (adenosine(37)-N6)-threonylcarbamoyltransferase complex ATPase subunit type 1 TsaE [Zhongshania]|jgi:tRNA threonylcarbamoyladenosine biosynthesis protein TsaE|uniref:tRNA threonylcarbamoyladenosine biosynthesis protein TsaE n=1 Tax=Zhongshania aquimaris TaxID=2857107 RepID=A0ABS6VQ53_9GAMM|nr:MULTISPECIES: tRNA (adenosine(37)-N6)-threonylcarbamoyltransferase complex ATPase subunit type 1 TsaE [Zhongshania]MBQ0796824.1 tRNA (adenosine(37)-N6)-threonylcarbamoyltransferase complex ATPase subunit type 1 TsaE [Zhongshania sp.]MBW2940442.1 tRNA (adenosine(37)-N6)-threonylcarbamoyltransferase complex ATPase subunit type 1 TsaE [Zhongshania aquimaris]|tara:strand:- start:339 stop:833 length:495 start_codon:yes stop_codon:yes gene_type:complete
MQRYLDGETETVAAGELFGAAMHRGAVVYLDGQLGAGKTTFCRGVLRAFGYIGPVKSPTYTLVEAYEDLVFGAEPAKSKAVTVYHFDLYRLGDPEELEYMGIRDYFEQDTICLIEWPQRGSGFLPSADIMVSIEPQGVGRLLAARGNTLRGQQILAQLSEYETD